MEIKKIGDRVLILRKNKKLTQKSFSNLIGMPQSYLSAIEKGRKNASLNFIMSIIDNIEVDADWLLKGKDSIYREEKKEREEHPKWLTDWWQKSDEAHKNWLEIQLTHIQPNTK